MAGTLTVDTIQSDSSYTSTLNVASKMNFTSGMQIGGQDTTFGGMRNRVINGDMRIDQRNAGSLINPAVAGYTIDRWYYYQSQTSKGTIGQDAGAVTPPVGFNNYLGFTSTSAYSINSTDQFFIQQIIECYNVADLGWGTADAKTITISFWVRSSLTGTFGGAIQNSGASRNYPFSYTINSANTWEYKTITVTGDTSGTWLKTNGSGLKLLFNLGSGSTQSATSGAWTGTSFISAPTGATSVVGTNGATFYITGVQLEKGSAASPFEYRSFGQELTLCQRYCYVQNKLVTNNYYAFGMGVATSGTTGQLGTPFPVQLRTNPSVTYSAANLFFVDAVLSATNGFTTITADQVGINFGFSSFSGATSSANGGGGRWLSNGTAAAYVIWSAEL